MDTSSYLVNHYLIVKICLSWQIFVLIYKENKIYFKNETPVIYQRMQDRLMMTDNYQHMIYMI